MTNKDFPDYVSEFKAAYDSLYYVFTNNGPETITSTKEFTEYAKAVKKVIAVKMYSRKKFKKDSDMSSEAESANFSCNRAMVNSLRESGEYKLDKIVLSSTEMTNKIYTKKSDLIEEIYREDIENALDSLDDMDSEENIPYALDNDSVLVSDDVLDQLFSEILINDTKDQYYIKKADAAYAFRSISVSVHNKLVDMCKKLPKPIPLGSAKDSSEKNDNDEYEIHDKSKKSTGKNINKRANFKIVNLDDTISDNDGNVTSMGSIISDPNKNTEEEATRSAMLKYGISVFVYKMTALFIERNKPHYMISYLNNISGGSGIELYEDIYNNGFDHALQTVTNRLQIVNIDVDHLNKLNLFEGMNNKDVKKNYPNNWLDRAMQIANAHSSDNTHTLS
ncbi:MAG: hypothetical protein IKQ44_00600 [Lachnospiraceae bacterium]|nr:hypothetical protein [Lachnospiraceae bacterium]